MSSYRAKAKLNLFIHVNGKRDDGYHLLESLVVFCNNIYDIIDINQNEINSIISVDGNFAAQLYPKEKNLISTCLETFAPNKHFHCKLTKNIPVGAGLGGGSSDAAAAVQYLAKEFEIKPTNQQLVRIGADVPVCYQQQPAYVSSIGEEVKLVKNLPKFYLLLVKAPQNLGTKLVFENFQGKFKPELFNKPMDFDNNFDYFISFISKQENNLTDAAISIFPEIKIILGLLKQQAGCIISRMSGSGSTCFAIFKSEILAKKAEMQILDQLKNHWVKYTTI